jgi:hypothetical protein
MQFARGELGAGIPRRWIARNRCRADRRRRSLWAADWQLGESFGHRGFLELVPIVAVGYALALRASMLARGMALEPDRAQ